MNIAIKEQQDHYHSTTNNKMLKSATSLWEDQDDEGVYELIEILNEKLQDNRKMRNKLKQEFDVIIELEHMDSTFINKSLKKGLTAEELPLFKNRLMYCIEIQTKQFDKLSYMLNSNRIQNEEHQSILEEQKNNVLNEYGFLRSHWVHHKYNNNLDVDDRIDKLNKVIAMIKGKMKRKIQKEKTERKGCQSTHIQELFEQYEYLKLKQKWQSSEMECEDLRGRLISSVSENGKLKAQNAELHSEMKKLKQKLKNIETRYLKISKREQQLDEKLIKVTEEYKRKREKVIVYKARDFDVEITGTALKINFEYSITKEIQEVRAFFESFKSYQINQVNQTYQDENNIGNKPLALERKSSTKTLPDEDLSRTSFVMHPLQRVGKTLSNKQDLSNVKFTRTTKAATTSSSKAQHIPLLQNKFYMKLNSIEGINRVHYY